MTPDFRLRCAFPVSHQVRDFCQVNPASCRMSQILDALIVGNPWRRNADLRVVSYQTQVPSRSRSGVERAMAIILARSSAV